MKVLVNTTKQTESFSKLNHVWSMLRTERELISTVMIFHLKSAVCRVSRRRLAGIIALRYLIVLLEISPPRREFRRMYP